MMRGKKKGFTLVELIVVIAIIAIIAAVAVPTTIQYVKESRVTMAENETLNLMNSIRGEFAILAIDKEGRVAKDTILELLVGLMPNVEYITAVTLSQDGSEKLKVTIEAGDYAKQEDTFSYTAFKLYWGEDSATSFTFVPDEEEVWALA